MLWGYPAMTDENKHDRVWDIVEKVGVCMLTTRFKGGGCGRGRWRRDLTARAA